MAEETKERIESELEVKAYIQNCNCVYNVISFCRESVYIRYVSI